jgi:hypothetical protein
MPDKQSPGLCKEQRVGVFVDVQTQCYSTKFIYKAKMNMRTVLSDAVVPFSGNGDFVPLAEHLNHALGCYVEIMSFGKFCSPMLIESADHFVDMDQDSQSNLISSGKG